jgi:hypothetical protein
MDIPYLMITIVGIPVVHYSLSLFVGLEQSLDSMIITFEIHH